MATNTWNPALLCQPGRGRHRNAILNAELEARVNARTAALKKANEQLEAEIQERKLVEDALRVSEERFRLLVQNSSDSISVLDREGVYLYVSPAVTGIIGTTPQNMLGQLVFARIHPEDRETVQARYQALLRRPGRVERLTYRYQHADGQWLHLEAIWNNLIDDPRVQGVVANTRDVTERKRAEDTLREQEREHFNEVSQLKDEFLQIVSHDLKTPVSITLGYATLLMESPALTNPTDQQCLEGIVAASRRMETLINDLLDISAINLGLQLQRQTVELGTFLEDGSRKPPSPPSRKTSC
ncbi:MAG: PAS domain S-box protein [Anaerolineae bacterium]|nr:PAS domain S-box protein [Anaerolineae bacterium]